MFLKLELTSIIQLTEYCAVTETSKCHMFHMLVKTQTTVQILATMDGLVSIKGKLSSICFQMHLF